MSSSDSEAGRELDSDSEQEEEREKLQPEKVKNEVVQPIPPPVVEEKPKPRQLTKAEREQIIKEFEGGKENPEFQVLKGKNGKYRLNRRKEFFTPSGKVDSPANTEIYERFKREFQEELKQHRAEWNEQRNHLLKKYKKLSARVKPEEIPWPAPPLPPPVFEVRGTPHVKPVRPVKRRRLDIRDF
jgi:hypothetical protein